MALKSLKTRPPWHILLDCQATKQTHPNMKIFTGLRFKAAVSMTRLNSTPRSRATRDENRNDRKCYFKVSRTKMVRSRDKWANQSKRFEAIVE